MSTNPIGYVEFQSHWIEASDGDLRTSREAEIDTQMRTIHPTHQRTLSRVEKVKDGAGVVHSNLYLGYSPIHPTSEPLNPSNLNNAPVNNIGDPARDNNIGWKEQKF